MKICIAYTFSTAPLYTIAELLVMPVDFVSSAQSTIMMTQTMLETLCLR